MEQSISTTDDQVKIANFTQQHQHNVDPEINQPLNDNDGHTTKGQSIEPSTYSQLSEWIEISKQHIRLSAPIVLSNLCRYILITTDLVFLSRYSTQQDQGVLYLDGSGISDLYIQSTWWFFMGLIWGMDSCVSQIVGSNISPDDKKRKLNIILYNQLFILTMAAIPVIVIWLLTEPILLLVGADSSVAHYSGIFSRYLIIGLLPVHWFRTIIKWLEGQAITDPLLYITILMVPVNIVLNYIFIYALELGYIGSPLATSVTRWCNLLLILLYLMMWKSSLLVYSYHQLDNNWDEFLTILRYDLHSSMMIGLEMFAIQSSGLVSLLFDQYVMAAFSISMSIISLLSAFGRGLTGGGIPIIGFHLGRSELIADKSIRVINYILINVAVIVSLVALSVIILRSWIISLFTDNQQVIGLLDHMLLFASLVILLDGIQNILGGILRAIKRPDLGSKFFLTTLMMLGLPTSFLLSLYTPLSWYGIWIGLSSGLTGFIVLSIGYLYWFHIY